MKLVGLQVTPQRHKAPSSLPPNNACGSEQCSHYETALSQDECLAGMLLWHMCAVDARVKHWTAHTHTHIHTHLSCQKGGLFNRSSTAWSSARVYLSTTSPATSQRSSGLSKEKSSCLTAARCSTVQWFTQQTQYSAADCLACWELGRGHRVRVRVCVCVCVCVCVGCHALISGSVLVQKVQQEFSTYSLFMHFSVSSDGTGELLFSLKRSKCLRVSLRCFHCVVFSCLFFRRGVKEFARRFIYLCAQWVWIFFSPCSFLFVKKHSVFVSWISTLLSTGNVSEWFFTEGFLQFNVRWQGFEKSLLNNSRKAKPPGNLMTSWI